MRNLKNNHITYNKQITSIIMDQLMKYQYTNFQYNNSPITNKSITYKWLYQLLLGKYITTKEINF